MTALALFLLVSGQAPAAPAPAVIALDDPSSSYCLATGFCRRAGEPGPASSVLFLAVGLVTVGVAGLRARPRN